MNSSSESLKMSLQARNVLSQERSRFIYLNTRLRFNQVTCLNQEVFKIVDTL